MEELETRGVMGDWRTVTTAALAKYQALGNDFLVALDPVGLPGTDELPEDFVIAVCDRHRGIGADGIIVVRPAGEEMAADGRDLPCVAMELRNADGGRAETSGNGLACLGLALVDAALVAGPQVCVVTDAGPRLVTVLERIDGASALVRVEMGSMAVGEAEPVQLLGGSFQARHVGVGNPHLVVWGSSLQGLDVAGLGAKLELATPGGQNVEFVAPDGEGGLELVVWERGAGVTRACGSGSCAAAGAARASGMVGDRVVVRNPGGSLVVDLEGEDLLAPVAFLSGRATRVFAIELRQHEIEALR